MLQFLKELFDAIAPKTEEEMMAMAMFPLIVLLGLTVWFCQPTETEGWLVPFLGVLPK